MFIIPAIDIKNKQVVRLYQGDFKNTTIYSDNPVSIANFWQNTGAKRLHLVDLDGAKDGQMANFSIIKKIISQISIPVQVGGGIRSENMVKKLIKIGADKIILGTIVLESKSLCQKLIKKYQDYIAIALDCKNGSLLKKGWQSKSKKNIYSTLEHLNSLGVKDFIFTDVGKDGTLSSPNYDLVSKLLDITKGVLTVSGGISSAKQIKKLESFGVKAVIVGKAFYENKLDPKEVFNVS